MFKHIPVDECKMMLDEGRAQCIDIRDKQSYLAGHIPTSTHVDNNNVDAFTASADKTRALLVCCYHGNSSQNAAEFFSQQGFEDVYSIDGGISAWAQSFACES